MGDARRGLVRAAMGNELISSHPQSWRNRPVRAALEAVTGNH